MVDRLERILLRELSLLRYKSSDELHRAVSINYNEEIYMPSMERLTEYLNWMVSKKTTRMKKLPKSDALDVGRPVFSADERSLTAHYRLTLCGLIVQFGINNS